nr:MAG TPA: hypothetical protein [Caudoviricetes sp.]
MIKFSQQLQRKKLIDSYIISHNEDTQELTEFLIVGWLIGTRDTIK